MAVDGGDSDGGVCAWGMWLCTGEVESVDVGIGAGMRVVVS